VPDICDLILDEHERFRREFARLDDIRAASGTSAEQLAAIWSPLAAVLEVHAAAEEQFFYPALLERGHRAASETKDAIADHNRIRDALHRASEHPTGHDGWWAAVLQARLENSRHMAEEERAPLPDLRTTTDVSTRVDLGDRWWEFTHRHAASDVAHRHPSPGRHISRHI
jgi:hypothetical protein